MAPPRPQVRITNRRRGGIGRWIVRIGCLLCLVLGQAGVIAAGVAYLHYARDLPPVLTLETFRPPTVTRFYSSDGRLLADFATERRVVVPIERLPQHLIQAFLASEDRRFFSHDGVDYRSIVRAALANYRAGRVVEGASTITQQLCKTQVGRDRSLARKVKEAILARRTERHLDKLQILELYLNQVYLGHGAYGVQAAAQGYFGEDAWDLSLAQAAMLAGLPPRPSHLNPAVDLEGSRRRLRHVLSRMVQEGFVSAGAADAAFAEPMVIRDDPPDLAGDRAPHYTEHARKVLYGRYGPKALYQGGLRVYLAVDADRQRAAQEALRQGLLGLARRQGYRGPVAHLPAPERAAFVTKLEARYRDQPPRPGRTFVALVEAVEVGGARIDAGAFKGTIALRQGMAWAAPYDETAEGNGAQIRDARKALRAGDVVLVELLPVPEGGAGAPIALRLVPEPGVQGALVSLAPRSGYVTAMVGGLDFDQSEYNRAFQGCRQPGSVFKPIVYSLALRGDYTLATAIPDRPIAEYDPRKNFIWKPRNFGAGFEGEIILRNALVRSRNAPSIEVLDHVGLEAAIEWARRLGITTPMQPSRTLVLGSECVYPWDMVRVFATFALRGQRPQPVFITRVEDRDGRVLEDRTAFDDPWAPVGPKLEGMLRRLFEPRPRAMEADTAYLMQTLLKAVVDGGTAHAARALGKPAAGKTGTTDAYDAWFVGFTESLVTGVWVGPDRYSGRKLGRRETGGRVALPIWLRYMKAALEGVAQEDFTLSPPPTIEFAAVDYTTGLLAAGGRRSIRLPFRAGTAPKQRARPAGSFSSRQLDSVEGRF